MIKTAAILISEVYIATLLVNLVFLAWRFKKMPLEIRSLIWFLSLGSATEIYSRSLSTAHSNNLFLLHIYTLFEFIAWTYFYRNIFRHKKHVAKFPWFVLVVSCLIIANSVFLEPLSGFNSNAKTLVQVLFICYSVYYFFDVFGKIDLTKPQPLAITLINFAVVFYYSGTLFIFMSSKLLANIGISNNQQYGFWAINSLLNLIFHIIILISLWTAAFRGTKS